MDSDAVLQLIRDVADEVINPRFRDLGRPTRSRRRTRATS